MTKSFWREIEEKKRVEARKLLHKQWNLISIALSSSLRRNQKEDQCQEKRMMSSMEKREAILLWITKEARRRQADESKLKEEEELGKKFEKNTCDNRSSRRQSLLVSNEEEDVKSGVNIHNKGLVYVLSCLIFSFGSGCHSSYTIWWCQERDAPILLSNNQSTNTMFRWSNWPNVL